MRRAFLLMMVFSLYFLDGSAQDTLKRMDIFTDTAWNHTLDDAQLILKVRVNTHLYMTDQGIFDCTVLNVEKGDFQSKKLNFLLEMVEFSRERYEKRFRALDNYNVPYEIYIGFLESKNGYAEVEDKSTGKKYGFFMSSTVPPQKK
jgi:hypothetical protein